MNDIHSNKGIVFVKVLKNLLMIMGVLSIVISCGQNGTSPSNLPQLVGGSNQSNNNPPKVINSRFILNGVDWVDVNRLSTTGIIRKNSKAVGNLSIFKGGGGYITRCTAFLVTPDTIMTNHHCVSNNTEANGAYIDFKYEAGNSDVKDRGRFYCSQYIGGSSALDMALLKCQGRPGDIYGVLSLDGAALSNLDERERIYIVHQNCNHEKAPSCSPTKKYSPGVIMKKRGEALDKIVYDADTLTGSSGSPVFLHQSNKVIALNNVGLYNSDYSGNMVGNANAGTPMHKIVKFIKTHFPQLRLGYVPPRF